jgi:hypothetical protein
MAIHVMAREKVAPRALDCSSYHHDVCNGARVWPDGRRLVEGKERKGNEVVFIQQWFI